MLRPNRCTNRRWTFGAQRWRKTILTLPHSLNNLAVLYQSQGRYAEAEPLYIQALDILRQAYGEQPS